MSSQITAQESARFHICVDELADIDHELLFEAKKRLLSMCRSCIFDVQDLDSSPMLFPALRIYHFNDRELYQHKGYLLYDPSPMEVKLSSLGVVSTRNETRCMIYIWKRLNAQRQALSPTISEKLNQQLQLKMDDFLKSHDPGIYPTSDLLDDKSTRSMLDQVQNHWRNREINEKLRLAKFDELRGLTTIADVPAEAPVLSLPAEQIISHHIVRASPLKVLFDVEGLTNELILLLWLIYEFYQDASPWRYYLDALPMEFDTALYYDEAELAVLQETPIGQEITLLQQKATATYNSVVPTLMQHYPELFHPKKYTLENWFWAQSVLDSRGIKLNLGEASAALCLLPLVDMINGAPVSFLEGINSVSLGPKDQDSYIIRTLVPLKSYKEIFMNYGAFANRELLLYYGYVTNCNEYDTFSFDLSLDDGPMGDVQNQVLSRLGLELDLHISNDGTIPASALMTFHLLTQSDSDLLKLSRIKDDAVLGKTLYNDSKESVAPLLTILKDLLNNIPLLSFSEPPSRRLEHVSMYLVSQRRILASAIAHHS